MAGADLVLPAAVLRSAGLEIVGMGTGTAASQEQFATAIQEFYELLRTGAIRVDIERVPLDRVAEVWHRDQGGRRPVLIP
jgi:NADPH2:quinone reductase